MVKRFKSSGKDKLILLILSDFDPDGEEIAHSLARSLRDDFDVDAVEPVKVALTREQVAMFELRGGGDEEAAASGVLQKAPEARLVILPAMSHVGISGESEVLVPMVRAFLDDAPPATPNLF